MLIISIFIDEGEKIGLFTGSNQTIGVLLLEFTNHLEMDNFFNNPTKYVTLLVI